MLLLLASGCGWWDAAQPTPPVGQQLIDVLDEVTPVPCGLTPTPSGPSDSVGVAVPGPNMTPTPMTPALGHGLFVMNADGSGQHELTALGAGENNPVWSPDGRWIAFVTYGPTFTDVQVVAADGSGLRAITASPSNDSAPAWRPGQPAELTFVSDRYTANVNGGDIFAINLAAAEPDPAPRQLTDCLVIGFDQDWAPDGARLAFVRDLQLVVSDLSGAQLRWLTSDDYVRFPAWSPTGKQLAYVSERDWQRDIYVLDVDVDVDVDIDAANAQAINLTHNPAADNAPAWSPDGKRIAFSSDRAGGGSGKDIYVMDVDGSHVQRLTSAPGDETDPNWSPDGRFIVFTNARGVF
jgi:Tol biopolymer transport system component